MSISGPHEHARLGKAGVRARDAISRLIESGVFGPGDKLPGERDLAEQVSVSRAVLRDALASLEREGRVENSPWRGWFVTAPHMAERVALQSFTDMARARGLTPGAHVCKRLVRAAVLEESRALAIAPASSVLEIHRVRTLDAIPTCYDVSVLPLQPMPGLAEADFENASLYRLLETVGNARVVRSDYTVRAESAPSAIAEALNIAESSPVLVGEELASDISGSPVMLGRVTYRQDAYEFQATLYRSYEGAP